MESIKDEQELKRILHGGFYYCQGDGYTDLRDGSHYTNHEVDAKGEVLYDPNGNHLNITAVAIKNIAAGEEITENYGNYLSIEAEWLDVLMRRFLPYRQ